MKKLLLLLALSLLSAQSFASVFCPDGSLPTRAISADGSYYESKCVGKQNKVNTKTSYGPKRLFDFGTSWVLSPTGVLSGTNGIVCFSFNLFVGTCNNGVNYGYCSSTSNELCGSDGTSYKFPTSKSIKSSFGSSCRNNGTGTHSVTCNPKSSYTSNSYSSQSNSSNKIPANAFKSGNTWYCKAGYYKFFTGAKDICRKVPKNATKNADDRTWNCDAGYVRSGNNCLKPASSSKKIPENAYSTGSYSSGDGWDCKGGYVKKGNKCVAKSNTQETKVIQNESSNYLEEIKQAKELLDSGVITQDEFTEIKKKIIDDI